MDSFKKMSKMKTDMPCYANGGSVKRTVGASMMPLPKERMERSTERKATKAVLPKMPKKASASISGMPALAMPNARPTSGMKKGGVAKKAVGGSLRATPMPRPSPMQKPSVAPTNPTPSGVSQERAESIRNAISRINGSAPTGSSTKKYVEPVPPKMAEFQNKVQSNAGKPVVLPSQTGAKPLVTGAKLGQKNVRTMKKGGYAEGGESKKEHFSEMKKMGKLNKEIRNESEEIGRVKARLTKHEDMAASKAHKGLKSGGRACYAKGGSVSEYANTKVVEAKKHTKAGTTGGVKGYKTGGVIGYKTGGVAEPGFKRGGRCAK